MPLQNPKTQRDDRTALNIPDQFGRDWLVKVELKTMQICGDVQPGGRWIQTPVGQRRDGSPIYSNGIDPLRTPQKYLKLLNGRGGRPDITKLHVDFEAWKNDQKRALRDWVTWLWDVGQQLNPGAQNIAEIEKDPRCLHHAGDKPWPSVRILELAEQGNRELLGLAPLQPSTQKLLKQISVETILREELDAFTPEEQEAYGLLARASGGRSGSVSHSSTITGAGTISSEPLPGQTYQQYIKQESGKGIPFPESLDRWRASRKAAVPA